MKNIIEKNKCCGCSACSQVCSFAAIKMMSDNKGFLYPYVDEKICVNCGICRNLCPSLKKTKKVNHLKVFACWNKDKQVLQQSSSGGFFSTVAEYVLDKGGVVYGSAFNEELAVMHIGIENKRELNKLRGSKYVQSDINNAYAEAKMNLEKGRYVLFSGTPCQIAGLCGFLHKRYDKLILLEVICHGVPSPLLWKKNLEYIYENKGKKVLKADFRNKKVKWGASIMYYKYSDGSEDFIRPDNDIFYSAFLKNLILRDSCYECKFKDSQTLADFSIGDYWGVANEEKDFYNEHGVSAIVINTEKGLRIWHLVCDKLHFKETMFDKLVKNNSSLITSSYPHKNRSRFFREFIDSNDFYNAYRNNIDNFNVSKDLKFSIWGGFCSRAIIRMLMGDGNSYIQYHYSNSSLISLMSKALVISEEDIKITNQYRKIAVLNDFNKLFVKEIEELSRHSNFIVIDFMEERFPIVKIKDSFITISDAFKDANINIDTNNLIKNSAELENLWSHACLNFINLLKCYFKPKQVILNQIYLSRNIGKQENNEFFENITKIDETNKRLKRYYQYFERNFPGIYKISADSEYYYTDKGHLYGCYAYHLNNDIYIELAKQIFKILGGEINWSV